MSVVDKALQHAAAPATPVTVQEAIASLLVAAITVDGEIKLDEAAAVEIVDVLLIKNRA
jgi:hypothetical protein